MREPMHRRHCLAAILLAVLLAAAPGAQTTEQTPVSSRPEGPARSEAKQDPVGQPVNIKLDLTISDQTGSGEPLKKVVTLLVADRAMGSIRSTGSVRAQGRVQINVDARPQILQSGAIRLALGLEYNPRMLGNDAGSEWSALNEQISVVVDAGKPLIVSQAADPASDRRITVEVRAAVMR